MCGRYALYGPVSRMRRELDALTEGFEFSARYNAAPMQFMPVLRQRPDGERVIHLLRWGLVPSWSKDDGIAARLINARAETVANKPSFRAAFRRRRCIVPANGFYEWQRLPDRKQPFYIHPAHGEFFAFAALWERWQPPQDGEAIDTYTILTTAANAAIQPLHDRMPVILAPDDFAPWLAQDTPTDALQALLQPCANDAVCAHPVSARVGNVRNDDAQLIEPA